MDIEKDVRAELNSFETSELERVLEALESAEYYGSGYKNLNGGYASAVAYEVEDLAYYDEELDMEVPAVRIEIESGMQDMGEGYSTCTKTRYIMPKTVLSDTVMDLRDKIKTVEDV